ncbi:MAG: hypothetical protein NCW75_01655 [Phycisphaera sp.]|nr:MAG: hypothetical protein NCW75_01655 [Phycisphaera sp.]
MCMVLYLATNSLADYPVAESLRAHPVSPAERPLCFRSLTFDRVLEVASKEGCACAFAIAWREGPALSYDALAAEDPEEAARLDRDRAAILAIIDSFLESGPVDVYSCWAEEEDQPPDEHIETDLASLRREWWLLRERRVVRVNG